MRLAKLALILFVTCLATGTALAQNEIIARAYRAVNVRSGPGTQYDIIGQLNSGNEVLITGRSNEESDWLRVDFLGRDGWLAYFTVTVVGDANDLPIVLPRATNATALAAPMPTPAALSAVSDLYITAYRRVNVRSGPGSSYVSIGSLEAGSTADVTGKSEDDVWLRIDYAGRDGWVAYFAVSFSGSIDSVQTVTTFTGAVTEVPQRTVEILTRYNVNLHEAPTPDSPVIAIIPYDVTLRSDGRSDPDSRWLRVAYRNQTGWLLGALVTAEGSLSILPIVAAR
jgi:N-acetylmuramoyl-L-alanine amidase